VPTAYADLREPTPIVEPVPGRRWPLWTRPLGYGLMTIVWFALLVLGGVGACIVVLPTQLSGIGDGRLAHAPMFDRSDWLATVIVLFVVAAPVLGAATYFLVLACLGITLSSATLFARSLRPRYRDERLSFSIWTRGQSVGPMSTYFTGVTYSLVPIRITRWSKVVTIIRFNGFVVNGGHVVLGPLWGLGYFWTIGWMLWPAHGVALVICAAISALIAAALVALIWRRRHVFADAMPTPFERTVYGKSWPNRPPSRPRRRPRPRQSTTSPDAPTPG